MTDQTLFPDTIFALSSGAVPSGVAVIRISGTGTRRALGQMTGSVPPPRRARLCAIRKAGGEKLDTGLSLFFPAPASFTGEDCGEIHVHGGRAVVASLLEALGEMDGFRLAEAGEFTRRAFLNGKMDLTGAEALSDLIAAETEAQRRFAMAGADGRHRTLYDGWRQRLVQARAMIEAELDFSDEQDVPGSVAEVVWGDLSALREEIATHAGSYRSAEIIRDGFRVVILGAPNAGKSSLLNTLAKRDIAIVTEEPGTTRDILEAALDIGGVKIIVSDTAGIRERPDHVEAIGIERAFERAGEADFVLLLEDAAKPVPFDIPDRLRSIRVGNKSDLLSAQQPRSQYDCLISTKTGAGLGTLVDLLGKEASGYAGRAADVMPFRIRHVALLGEAGDHLERALNQSDAALELRAEELRLASEALGRITGAIDVEELLDTIFSQFCIGK